MRATGTTFVLIRGRGPVTYLQAKYIWYAVSTSPIQDTTCLSVASRAMCSADTGRETARRQLELPSQPGAR